MAHLPKPTIWGVDARAWFQVATPIFGGLIALGGAVLSLTERYRQAGIMFTVLGGTWSLVTSVGESSRRLDRVYESRRADLR